MKFFIDRILFKTIFLSVVGLIFLTGCEKEVKNNNWDESAEPTQFELVKSDLVPYELLAFKMNNTWSNAPDSMLIGQINIAVTASDSFLVGFCPNLPPGEYPISIKNGKFKTFLSVKASTVVEPTAVYDSLLVYMDAKSSSSIAGSVNIIKESIQKEWLKLSSSQKTEVAQIIYTNNWHKNTFPTFDENAFLDSVRSRSNDYSIDELLKETIKNHTKRVVKLSYSITLAAVGAYTIPATGVLGAVVSGVGIYKMLDNWDLLKKEIEELSFLSLQIEKIVSIDQRSSLVVMNEKSTPIQLSGMYSTYSQSDESRADAGWVFSLLDKVQTSIDMLNEGIRLVNKKSIINIPLVNISAKKLLRTTETTKLSPIAFDNVIITKVSNPSIKLTLERDGKHQIKINTTSTITEETNFTFEIKYQSNVVSSSTATKAIDAVYKPAQAYLLGTWNQEYLSENNSVTKVTQPCYDNGNFISDYTIFQKRTWLKNELVISESKFENNLSFEKEYTSNDRPKECGGVLYSTEIMNIPESGSIIELRANEIVWQNEDGDIVKLALIQKIDNSKAKLKLSCCQDDGFSGDTLFLTTFIKKE